MHEKNVQHVQHVHTFSVNSTFSAYKNVKIATKKFYEEEQGPSEKEEYFDFKGLNLDEYLTFF